MWTKCFTRRLQITRERSSLSDGNERSTVSAQMGARSPTMASPVSCNRLVPVFCSTEED